MIDLGPRTDFQVALAQLLGSLHSKVIGLSQARNPATVELGRELQQTLDDIRGRLG
jgi:hypothetical protein